MAQSLDDLDQIVQGQSERTIMPSSTSQYLSRVGTLTNVLNNCEALRASGLVLTDEGAAILHTGKASNIFKFQFPINPLLAKRLMALISTDATLPKANKRKRAAANMVVQGLLDQTQEQPIAAPASDPRNPAMDKVTVSAQTFQNYKSALKWWHTFNCPEMGKVGCADLSSC